MSFADDVNRFVRKIKTQERDIFVGVAQLAHESIVVGSPITGAPGQPVDTGALRASWQLTFPSATQAEISTNIEYAPIIEHNIRGAQLRSTVGGFHSVKLTVAGFDRIVDHVTRQVTGGGRG